MAGEQERQRRSPALDRRRFLKLALASGAGALVGYFGLRALATPPPPPPLTSGCDHTPAEALDTQGGNISVTGVRKDGIPSIDQPKFVSATEASTFVADDHIVFGLAAGGLVRAYPQRILVWHEVVNDATGPDPLTVTYCPLTGSQVAFQAAPPGGSPLTFGITGRLVNSNLLMYDRETDSNWPQIYGHAIEGDFRGARLDPVPLTWTTWGRWRARHPETRVLSTDTGFVRNYQGDPYGSYDPLRGYYADRTIRFNLVCRDARFHPKQVFVGLQSEEDAMAVEFELLRRDRAINVTVADQPVALLHDEELEAPRAYLATTGAGPLHLTWDGSFRDAETHSRWSSDGAAISGPLQGARLAELPAMNVMWFAWAAFYPWTQVRSV